jgi:hypothetical protein
VGVYGASLRDEVVGVFVRFRCAAAGASMRRARWIEEDMGGQLPPIREFLA